MVVKATSAAATTTATNVVYYPSNEDELRFMNMPTTSTNKDRRLPPQFPEELVSPLVWKASDVAGRANEWTIKLSHEDIQSIDEALRHFQSLALGPSSITRTTFPLNATLARRLRSVSEACYNGLGFCILRGLDPNEYSLEENIVIYAGVSAYIAPERGFQDKERSEVLCHVFNRVLLKDAAKEKETPAFTEGAMAFHTDLGEILSLYTINVDQEGHLLLASAWQVYNELASTRPDIIHTLSEEWIWDTFADYEKMPPIKMPLMAFEDGKLLTHCSRYPLTGFGSYQRNADLPAITAEQMDALNAVHFIAQRNALKLPNVKGDMLYINNMALLHGRMALRKADGGQEALSARHKLKFFLRDPEKSWQIPQGFERIWNHLYGSNTTDNRRNERWILEPDRKVSRRWMVNG